MIEVEKMIINENLKARRSVGESKSLNNHHTKKIHLKESEAIKLAKLVSQEMNWPLYTVTYTHRDTKRTNARVWPSQKRMIVNVSGERVSTILHELAHHRGRGHNKEFKMTHIMLTRLWETKWESMFKDNCTVIKSNTSLDNGLIVRNPPKKGQVETIMELNKMINEVVEEIVDEIDGNSTVTMGFIGRKLLELKINNVENIQSVLKHLKELGVSVKVGNI